MTELTPDEKAMLRKMADAATQGPWHYCVEVGTVSPPDEQEPYICAVELDENGAFIAAASPASVLALLDENARLSSTRAPAQELWIPYAGSLVIFDGETHRVDQLTYDHGTVRLESGAWVAISLLQPAPTRDEPEREHDPNHELRVASQVATGAAGLEALYSRSDK